MADAAYVMVVGYSPVPAWDQWAVLLPLLRSHSVSFNWLWVQHNEHRILIPKLFVLADVYLFKGNQVFLLASIFSVQLAMLLLLGWVLRVLGRLSGVAWRTGVGLAAFCLFCPSQLENLVSGFQVSFVLVGLFAALSLLIFVLHCQAVVADAQPHWGSLAASLLLACAATFSLGSGMVLWPLLLMLGWFLRSGMKTWLTTAVAGGMVLTAYLRHFSQVHAQPLSAMRSPARLAEYVAAYFGSSWWGTDLRAAIVRGATGLVLAALLAMYVRERLQRRDSFMVVLLSTITFCVGSALLTALGRLTLGIDQAFAGRYQTTALLFWCCLGLLLLGMIAGEDRSRLPRLLLLQFLLLAILVGAGTRFHFPAREARARARLINTLSFALMTGVNDAEPIASLLYPDPQIVWKVVPSMRARHLAAFSTGLYEQLHKPFDSLYELLPATDCIGAVAFVEPMPNDDPTGYKVSGWAWDRQHQRLPQQVVVVAGQTITGFGQMGYSRPDVRRSFSFVRKTDAGFIAYAEAPKAAASLRMYAILNRSPRQACWIGDVRPEIGGGPAAAEANSR